MTFIPFNQVANGLYPISTGKRCIARMQPLLKQISDNNLRGVCFSSTSFSYNSRKRTSGQPLKMAL